MFSAKILLILTIELLLALQMVSRIDAKAICGPNACARVRCVSEDKIKEECLAKKGIYNQRSGWCSCCPNCLKRLC